MKRPRWADGAHAAVAGACVLYIGLGLTIYLARPAGLAAGLLVLAHDTVAAPLLLLAAGRAVWLDGRRAGRRDPGPPEL